MGQVRSVTEERGVGVSRVSPYFLGYQPILSRLSSPEPAPPTPIVASLAARRVNHDQRWTPLVMQILLIASRSFYAKPVL